MSLTERRKRLQELKEQEKSGNNSATTSTTTGSTIYSSSRAKRLAEMKQAEQQERLSTVSSELTSRIDTWFKNNENYINNYNSRFSGVTGSYTDPYDAGIKDWERTVKRQNLNFYAEADSIKSIIEENKDYLNPDWANEVLSSFDNALKVQRDIVNNSSERVKYFSNWDSEESYKRYQKIASIADMTSEQIKQYLSGDDPVAYVDDEGNEVTWDSLYKSKYYKEFTGKEDFADKSKSGYAAYEADIQSAAEREEAKKKDEKWYEKLGRYLGDAGPDTTLPNSGFIQATNDIRKDTSYMKPSNSWSQEQKDIYGYLYSTDKGAAAEYAQYANELNNQASNEKKTAAIEDWATKNGLTGSLATLGSIAMMPMSLVDSLGAMIEYGERGFISTSAEPLPGQVSGAITSAISKTLNQKYGTLNENAPVVGGKGWGDVYQLGTSIANSMISAYTQGRVGTFMVFFGSASASGMYEAKERGATDEQAITYGVLSGLAEAAGETFSVDKLLGLAGVDELKSFFGNVLLQAGIEASEEGFTTFLNNFADQLVMGDKSNFNVLVNYYMTEKKLSEEEAKRKAWADMANDLAFDMLGGAISGGTSAGLQTGIQTGVQGLYDTAKGKEYKDTYGTDIVPSLAGEAVEIDPNSKFAQKMQAKVEGGGELSNRQVGKLVRQNETAMRENDIATMKKAAEDKLTARGERGDVKKLAEIIVKSEIGEKLTRAETNALEASDFGRSVRQEMSRKSLNSDQEMDRWAESLNTDRINADVYSRMVAEMENEGASAPKTEADTQQVTGKLPASKTEFATDTNVGDKTVQEPAVASEGLTEAREEKTATYETPEVKDAQTGKVEAPEAERVADTGETIAEAEEESGVTLEAASAKYGAQAGAMVHTYTEGQDVAKYDAAYGVAYDMGRSGVNLSYAMNSEATAYLTENQRQLAYEAGTAASKGAAEAQDAKNKAAINGKTGRKKGVVKGDNVTLDELRATFNDTQNIAYKLLSTYAEATGVNIVLYKSEANADGKFDEENGRFDCDEDTIYINIDAGLSGEKDVSRLEKYTMLRTFSHDFTHFIEKWNPIWYNELRKVVFDTMTANGENVDDLIQSKQAEDRSGKMTYEEASREVVAEGMTDILPDANFVTELATNHKNLFEKLLAKLKEFLSDLKAYFDAIKGTPSTREAKALKEQVGEGVKYLDNIVKLFDRVAVEAVENYQMTVAVDAETNNTDGGITNVTERAEEAERSERADTGGDSVSQGEKSGTREEDGGRSRVPEEMGEDAEGRGEVYARLNDDNDVSWLTDEANYITPAEGSKLHNAQQAFAEEYGVECHIIKAEAWKRDNPATIHNENVYVSESINEDTLSTLVPHEGTHTMKQRNFQPYMEFIERTPDNLIIQTDEFDRLSDIVSKHRKIDIFDMTKKEFIDFYDELNSFVYGIAKSGIIENAEFNYGWVKGAFNDFDAYINELSSIHEQFKKENTPKQTAETEVTEAAAPEVDTRSLEEREKEYKKKYSSWLKRAIKQYVMHYGDTTFLSNGALGLKASEDMIGFARSEFVGQVYETDVPDQAKTALDNANTLLTEAPLEGTLKDNTPVYVFNVDGKQRVFDKKHLSKLDGNLLYIGDFTREAKIIKAVDADGNVVGFLLPMKLSYEVTATKPSKLKSFSSKFQSQIKQEVNNNVENADNKGAVFGSDTDRQGASRLLDEVQAGDVPRAASGRGTLEADRKQEQRAGRDDNRADTVSRDSGGDGSSEVGDLRRDGLTDETAAEKLHEEVEKQIEQKSTVEPKGRNFVIGDSLNLPDGEKARYRANVDAIRLIKQLETEGRYATEAEQEILSKYVGWGGLSNVFGELKYNREARRSEMTAKDGWEKEFAELRSLVDEGVITEQEYKDMSASTKNAHYTSIEVIKAMYDGLASLGFKGGRMLEPSSGVGNFVGAMPTSMSAGVNSWTMVELDRITGLIAKYLYPNADVRIQGFENANIPDNYMDVAIGNVPFGNFGVVDRAYPKRITKSIHNYFFAKSLDKVRPGGIVMFITSSFTMNSSDSAVRKYIMDRADLLGAIRLPNTAFKGNAGTEVVTDILVLKKRESGTDYAGEDFLESTYNYEIGADESSYFKNHPEMVLGKAVTKRGMYGAATLTYEPYTDRGTIDDQIRAAFKNIKGEMTYPEKLSREKTNFAVERANKKTKSGGFVVNSDGSISKNDNGQLVKVDTDEKTAKRIAGMLSIRDAYRKLASYLQQGLVDTEIKRARKELNTAYDKFIKEFGLLNSPVNKKAIDSDPDRYAILSLEHYDAEKKTAKKADIFTKDTISANKTVTHVDSVPEGVIASINLMGGVNAEFVAKLTGKTVEDVTRDIIDSRLAFKTRDGALVAREAYLSGNVRAKLREAEALAPFDADYNNNVEELRRVIPADIPYNEIYVTPGATFIPNEVYADFIAHMLGGRNYQGYGKPDVEVGRSSSGEFKIIINNARLKSGYYNRQTWGTARRTFLELFDAMMSSRSVKVNDTIENADGKKISVVNEAETEAANEKVKAIQKEFEEWIWKDESRREALAKLYNETFNALVNPKYDGAHLSVNGINPMFNLMEHQANAVHRVIASGGNTLLAHRVGAGKTLEMAAAAMKMRELGIVKKPVFVVPKNVVAQWGVEFSNYFPAARLLVADDKSFTPANRKVFTNMIANGDYDAVIVTYEQFEKIPMSAEYQAKFYEEQINEIIDAIAEEKAESRDGKGLTVKEMEKKKAQLEKKLKELTSKPKDEDNVDFEMLGIDSLFVDEAHNFKNLEYVSKMTNVAGLGNSKGAQRSFDLYTKVRYLQGLNGGRGIVFATATPVMNSMVELYIMQRYLQPDVLQQLGLKSFDAWAKVFGEVVNKWEINPSGTGMRQKQVFANFRNLSELQLLFRSFTDVVTELPYLKIPKMKGGAVKIVECEPGEFQKNYMLELQKRAENVKNVDPSEDNMLKITSDGRKVSYTQRMIDPTLPYEPSCKIFRAGDNIVKEYRESADIKGTQIVFLDMATPKGSDKSKTDTSEDESLDTVYDEENARLYDDMRDYLVKKGIPKREIAFIHEAATDAKRKQLFEDVNEGKVRVLIGSTGKMGVGMNAQKRVVAIHHLDAPWRPGDVEQRDGRAFRQKNINDEVSKYVYVTTGSFDSRLWDILDRKQHFINQIMNGEDVGRTAEDTGEVTLSAAEVKALASGNPLIEEQTKLTDEIKKLENLQKAYNSSMRLARTKLSDDVSKIASFEKSIERIREDISARVDTYSEGKFAINIGGKQLTDKKDAGATLAAAIIAKANKDAYTTVAKFAGFEIRVIKEGAEYKGVIQGKESYKFNVYLNNTTRMVNHLGEIIAGFENIVKNYENQITELTADRDAQENILSKPFEKQTELAEKRARFNEVMELLAPKGEEQLGTTDEEGKVQYQQRREVLSDREVLQIAADKLGDQNLTEGERGALDIFKKRLAKLDALQTERTEQGRLYKEQQFGANVDRAAAAQTLNRMHVLDDKIKAANAEVLDLENKKVLGDVLKKARKVVEAEERAHGAEILKRWRERTKIAAEIKKYRDRIKKDVDDLTSWINKPNNKDITKHVPGVIKNSVIDFLESIDFTSTQQLRGGEATKADKEFVKKIADLEAALVEHTGSKKLYADYYDIPPGFVERLGEYIKDVEALTKKHSGEYVINKMSSEELKELAGIIKILKHFITGLNKFHHNAVYSHVFEAGDDFINEMSLMKKDDKTTDIVDFVTYKNIRPSFVWERFGRAGIAIRDELQAGHSKFGMNARVIVDFVDKTYTAKEVEAYRNKLHTFELGGEKVTMRVSHMMGLYLLDKQQDSKDHIIEGGIRVGTFQQNGKGKKYSSVSHILTQTDIDLIVGKLTARQKAVADALQKFMAEQGAKWGNEVSVKRFGEALFGLPDYYPIAVDPNTLPSKKEEMPEGASLYALLNRSFTKARNKDAKNGIMLYDIFDVFASHMSSMAQYNALALPVLDATKWLDYQQKADKGDGISVRSELTRVFGSPVKGDGYAVAFIDNILKDINGTGAQGTTYDNWYMKMLHYGNRAKVSFKVRTAVLQATAISRAGLLLDSKSILANLKSIALSKQNTEEMLKYSGIAVWKDLGFYDTNISRGMHQLITRETNWSDKATDFGLKGAEAMDRRTWSAIWGAAKTEVIRKQGLKPSDAGFYEAVKQLFEDVIYKTQVVDSVLTKSELMRSKSPIARTASSFMGESVATVSPLIDAYVKIRREGWSKHKAYFGRAVATYAISQAIVAMIESIFTAWFDDDEYETFGEKYVDALINNFISEIDIPSKIPYIGDAWEALVTIAKAILNEVFDTDFWSYSNETVSQEIVSSATKIIEIVSDKIKGEDTKYEDWAWIYAALEIVSTGSGVGFANMAKEVVGIWNHTIGVLYPDLKVKSYNPGERNEIKYAYLDKYLTEEEATQHLLEKGIVKNKYEAFFEIEGWKYGMGYSKFGAYFDAIVAEDEEQIKLYYDNLYGEKISDGSLRHEAVDSIHSSLKTQVKEAYIYGEIGKETVYNVLVPYADMSEDDIKTELEMWDFELEYDFSWSERAKGYRRGEITGNELKEAVMEIEDEDLSAADDYIRLLNLEMANQDIDITADIASKYFELAEPAGIDLDVFIDFKYQIKGVEGDKDRHGNTISGTKKAKIMDIIDSLPLSKEQKDALYYASGYEKSTIREAPWR
jgi:N12 class adenine-specific DNA methylase